MALVRCPKCQEAFEVDAGTLSSIVDEEVARRIDAACEEAAREAAEAAGRLHAAEAAKAASEAKAATEAAVASAKEGFAKTEATLLSKVAVLEARLQSESVAAEARESEALARGRGEGALEAERLKGELALERSRSEAEKRRLEDEIVAMREMRSRLSTKLVGESLEAHCESEFRRLQSAGVFPDVEFTKDTKAVSYGEDASSKGDFIYRQMAPDGECVLSIMFEMKTEEDASASRNRRRNEDHLAKLDRDRRKKGCEFAVLVSTLEAGSDLYDAGIVDVSTFTPFEKAYVVRPQCFLTIIGLLRSMAAMRLAHKAEMAGLAQRDLDLMGLRDEARRWVDDVLRSDEFFRKNVASAMSGIDAAIDRLTKVRDELRKAADRTYAIDRKAKSKSVEKLAGHYDTLKGLLTEGES